MSMVSDIADAVAAELSAGTFSVPFQTIRAFRHEQTLPEGKELRVSVIPKGVAVVPVARAACTYTAEIFVAVMKKVDDARPETIDPLLALVEEIVDFFRLRRLANFPAAAWVGTEVKPMVSTEHLEGLKQFTSLITVSWRVVK